MAKLRKMLGDINSQECISMMRLIETQSEKTLAGWAVSYAKDHYLGIYEKECPDDPRLREAVLACESYLGGDKKLSEIKGDLKEAGQIARDAAWNPVAQAAARAVSAACSSVRTPTNTLGFLFYGAAAAAYCCHGLDKTAEFYDECAAEEFRRAYSSLEQASAPDEPCPAEIKWNC